MHVLSHNVVWFDASYVLVSPAKPMSVPQLAPAAATAVTLPSLQNPVAPPTLQNPVALAAVAQLLQGTQGLEVTVDVERSCTWIALADVFIWCDFWCLNCSSFFTACSKVEGRGFLRPHPRPQNRRRHWLRYFMSNILTSLPLSDVL